MSFLNRGLPRLLQKAAKGSFKGIWNRTKIDPSRLNREGSIGFFKAFKEQKALAQSGMTSRAYRLSGASAIASSKGMLITGLALGAASKAAGAMGKLSTFGTPGVVGYGKRGIDANNLNTDGLVQGLSRNRRQ